MSNKISMDKKYRTRDGRDVRVLCVDKDFSDDAIVKRPVIALVKSIKGSGESVYYYSSHGYFCVEGHADQLDLIEVKPYDDFEIDEPVYVRDSENEKWRRRHFAGVDDKGCPLVFMSGAKKWSSNGYTIQYRYCIKAGDLDNVDDSES